MLFHSYSQVINNTIVANKSDSCGGGFYWKQDPSIPWKSGRSLTIANNIVRDNTAFLDGNEVYPGTLTLNHCNVKGGYAGAGNIDVDPEFIDATNNDYHLLYTSPCRDAGSNAYVTGSMDFEGDPRLAWGGTVDIGADEFYTHLYYTGDATPGGDIQGKLVGLPATWPVGLFFGESVMETAWHHMWGDFWLEDPWFVVPLVPIPANGVLVMPTTLPFDPPAPWDLPMQCLVGLNSDSLTNLCVIEVR